MFGPKTLSWRVSREPALFLGGGRALLMQVAHPAVAAGVSQHSDYDTHPWRRLFRTLDTTLKMAFGSDAVSARACARLDAVHHGVHGYTEEGAPYSAFDPEPMLWVWATLVSTTVLMYNRCVGRLRPPELETLYAEQRTFAETCGVPSRACPRDWRSFSSYVDEVIDEDLKVTDTARSIARSVLYPGPAALGPALFVHSVVTAELLPDRLRREYGLSSSGYRRAVANNVLDIVKLGSRTLPSTLRHAPVSAVVSLPERLTARGRSAGSDLTLTRAATP